MSPGDIVMREEQAIRHADGTETTIPACNYPHFTLRGSVETRDAMEPPTTGGWVEDAEITTSTSFGGVLGDLTVPSAPTSRDGQILYLFPGLEEANDPSTTILQPVLGWNAFSNETGWSISSWNCCYEGVNLYSTPMAARAGDLIIGEVMSNCASGTLSCPTWYVSTEDATKGSTTLGSTSSYGQTFNWATGGALEAYDVAQCSDYPPGGSISFGGALYDNSFDPIFTPSWSLDVTGGFSPQCNYGGQATNGITLDY
jgi:hypothetical protein